MKKLTESQRDALTNLRKYGCDWRTVGVRVGTWRVLRDAGLVIDLTGTGLTPAGERLADWILAGYEPRAKGRLVRVIRVAH